MVNYLRVVWESIPAAFVSGTNWGRTLLLVTNIYYVPHRVTKQKPLFNKGFKGSLGCNRPSLIPMTSHVEVVILMERKEK